MSIGSTLQSTVRGPGFEDVINHQQCELGWYPRRLPILHPSTLPADEAQRVLRAAGCSGRARYRRHRTNDSAFTWDSLRHTIFDDGRRDDGTPSPPETTVVAWNDAGRREFHPSASYPPGMETTDQRFSLRSPSEVISACTDVDQSLWPTRQAIGQATELSA